MMTEKKNDHGGGRPGAGRPKGSVERFTSRNLKHFTRALPDSAARSHDERYQRAAGHEGRDECAARQDGNGSGALPASTIVRARARRRGAAVFDGSHQADRRRANRI